MSTLLKKTIVAVLNVIAATYGDVVVGAGNVTINGLRPFKYDDATLFTIEKSLVETVNTLKVFTTSVAVNTYYEFSIVQFVNEADPSPRRVDISVYNGDPGMTLLQLEAAIALQVQGYIDNGFLKMSSVAIGGPEYGVTLSGIAGYPIFLIDGSATNMTVESLLGHASTVALDFDGTLFTSVISAFAVVGSVVTLTSVAHTVLEGQSLRVTGFAGTLDGIDGTQAVVARVTAVTANTLVLDGVVGVGVGIGTVSAVIEPQNARGNGADLLDQSADIVSTNVYTKLSIKEDKNNAKNGNAFADPSRDELVLYFDEGAANYSDLYDRFVEIKHRYKAGTTDADPALGAL